MGLVTVVTLSTITKICYYEKVKAKVFLPLNLMNLVNFNTLMAPASNVVSNIMQIFQER